MTGGLERQLSSASPPDLRQPNSTCSTHLPHAGGCMLPQVVIRWADAAPPWEDSKVGMSLQDTALDEGGEGPGQEGVGSRGGGVVVKKCLDAACSLY